MKKGFSAALASLDADVVCLQETKLQEDQRTEEMINIPPYESYWSYSTIKKGYSGVAAYSRIEPEQVKTGIGIPDYDAEGRILELDFNDFILFNIYFPNGQMSDERLQYKLDFYEAFFDYTERLRKEGKSLIITGDFNTAHNEIDLKNPGPNSDRSGFLPIERQWIDRIIDMGYVDTFRHLYPDTVKYSWWSYRMKARERNTGWRIDYFMITPGLEKYVKQAEIHADVMGSDHCPVSLALDL